MEKEAARYTEASDLLDKCGSPRERLTAEKAEIYQQLTEANRSIRAERKKLALFREIQERVPKMKQSIEKLR